MKTLHNYRKSITVIGMLFLLSGSISSCSNNGEPEPQQIQPPVEIKSGDKQITSFVFLLTKNAISNNVVATIDEENKTITSTMPAGTDITGLLPEIEISANATVSPIAAQNFTTGVSYTVTAEDGSQVVYAATVTVPLSQRQILQTIINSNPENTLNWDLPNIQNLGALEGVTVDVEGRITELILPNKNLSKLNAEIGLLTSLTNLRLYNNQITSLPSEIGQLKDLKTFFINDNQLTSLPTELFTLTGLDLLNLSSNNLGAIPAEIGQLTNLIGLGISENQLTSLPLEIFTLTDLEILEVYHNSLTTLPSEIGQLTKLTYLAINNNELTSLPPEIGFLIKLTTLNVTGNAVNVIPQAICNLKEFNNPTMDFYYDAGIICSTTSQMDALINIYSANPGNTLGWGVNNFPGVVFESADVISEIEIKNKGIKRIQVGVATLTSLRLLDIRNNPLGFIPSEVCALQSPTGHLTLLTDPGEGCEP